MDRPPECATWCTVCGRRGVPFLPLPELYRENALRHGYVHFGRAEMSPLDTYACSHCGASDRERLYAFWIDEALSSGALTRRAQVLHFAPEIALGAQMRARGFDGYVTADIAMQGVDRHEDLTSLSFPDERFDLFICSHVLEHVVDDRRAIRELWRVTRHGGRGIVMAPIIVGLPATLEDPAAKTDAERWRLFGQNDHVRLYAHDDFVARIREGGFEVRELGIEHFGAELFTRLGLKATSVLYLAEKR